MAANSKPRVERTESGDMAVEGNDLLIALSGLLSRMQIFGMLILEGEKQTPKGSTMSLVMTPDVRALISTMFRSADDIKKIVDGYTAACREEDDSSRVPENTVRH